MSTYPTDYLAELTETLPRSEKQPQCVEDAALWAMSVPGWMTKTELFWLGFRANALNRGDTWAEVGTWRGRSLAAAVLSVPYGANVVAVDHWQGSEEERATFHADAEDAYTDFLELRQTLDVMRPGVLRVIEGESAVAAGQFADRSLAGVFIDGSHDYRGFIADLHAWGPKVRRGGLLCGHDANSDTIAMALNEVLGDWWTRTVGSIWRML